MLRAKVSELSLHLLVFLLVFGFLLHHLLVLNFFVVDLNDAHLIVHVSILIRLLFVL